VDVQIPQRLQYRKTRVREFFDIEVAVESAHPPLPQTT
jgi:hypothetical protein